MKNKKNIKSISKSKSEHILTDIMNSEIIKNFEEEINIGIDIRKIDNIYGKKLGQERYIYNLPLSSKLSKKDTIELAKMFFSHIGGEISEKTNHVIDEIDSRFKFTFEEYGELLDKDDIPRDAEMVNLNEIYCPRRGDLRDLYGIVHEVTHTLDLTNGDNEARKIFGEILPQCMERMLDEYLLNLTNEDLLKYELDRDILIADVRNRQVSTFLSRKDNIVSFNKGNNIDDKRIDLRYILAQIYSFKYMSLNSSERISKMSDFIKNIEENNVDSCSKSFGVDLKSKLKMQFTMQDIVSSVKNTNNQIILQETLQEILTKSKYGKNFKVSLGNQNIHINLESKIPFILVTSSHLKDGQTLVMESNNIETDNKDNLIKQGLETSRILNNILKGNNSILIPLLPSDSSTGPYFQQLSVECFQNGERSDLDIVNAINEAKVILAKEYNTRINDKIFLNGYSSSGCFAQRFSLIHPELIDTACIGGASGSIPMPSTDLDYPLGIKNYEKLFGKKFKIEDYKKITFDYYVGELECKIKASTRFDENGDLAPMHDMSYFNRSVPTDVGKAQREALGKDMFIRAENTIKILKSMEIRISHKVIPNTAHNYEEALDLMRNNPRYKNVSEINNIQNQIISSSFAGIVKRNLNIVKENNERY